MMMMLMLSHQRLSTRRLIHIPAAHPGRRTRRRRRCPVVVPANPAFDIHTNPGVRTRVEQCRSNRIDHCGKKVNELFHFLIYFIHRRASRRTNSVRYPKRKKASFIRVSIVSFSVERARSIGVSGYRYRSTLCCVDHFHTTV